ncbi:hypothetical protein MASR1M36_19700 [Candidatus Cloacimonadaceae bacterium]
MIAPKQLPKPVNWQDFETLCKKLWGEIWNCPDIKKNGRLGQAQNGVDVYGIPEGEKEYYGIQCKGKNDYVNSTLSLNEIIEEISKAEQFEPPLKKLYFATSACKDASIEQHIRQINIDRICNEKFEVHLYSWEDIVDLIEENHYTYQYYVNSINVKDMYDAVLCFDNGQDFLKCNVPFDEITTEYVFNPSIDKMEDTLSKAQGFYDSVGFKIMKSLSDISRGMTTKYNASIAEFRIKLTNSGSVPLMNCKVIMIVEGEYGKTKVFTPGIIMIRNESIINTYVSDDSRTISFIPNKDTLVPENSFYSETIQISPIHADKSNHVIIKWRLLTNSFQKEGVLDLILEPTYIQKTTTVHVNSLEEERTEKKYAIHEEEGSLI